MFDRLKPGGGNINEGRTLQEDLVGLELSAAVTLIDTKTQIIREVINRGHTIDTDSFSFYADGTARLYISKYKWYPVTATVHKILVRGAKCSSEPMILIR